MMYLFRYCGFALFEYFPSVIYCWVFSGVTPVTQERLAPFARPFSFSSLWEIAFAGRLCDGFS